MNPTLGSANARSRDEVRTLRFGLRVIPPVLCYHKIERRLELGATRLSPRRFGTQMEALAKAGWRGISLSEFAACVRGERTSSGREVLITFDDAYRGLREHAFPALRGLGFAAVCFVITEYAGRLNRWDVAYGGRRFAHLAWRDIERWHECGVAFESHTASHPRLPWVDERRMRDELEQSRRTLADALGTPPTAIAYPFGAVTPRERLAASRAGYRLGFALGGRWRGDALRIPRHAVHCWSPRMPGVGPLAILERLVAAAAGRCAVGTSLWLRLTSARRSTSRSPAAGQGDAPTRRQRFDRVSAGVPECG